jgi:uncharacterized protein YutE (UPF0331/DUF86 family)
MSDVLLNKKMSIERCLQRIRTTWQRVRLIPFEKDFDRQDIIVLNLLRACEQAIDMANYVLRARQLGLPQTSRDSFQLLADAGLISTDLADRMQKMVGFRDIGVHEYQKIDLDILGKIIEHHLDDFVEFTNALLKHFPPTSVASH